MRPYPSPEDFVEVLAEEPSEGGVGDGEGADDDVLMSGRGAKRLLERDRQGSELALVQAWSPGTRQETRVGQSFGRAHDAPPSQPLFLEEVLRELRKPQPPATASEGVGRKKSARRENPRTGAGRERKTAGEGAPPPIEAGGGGAPPPIAAAPGAGRKKKTAGGGAPPPIAAALGAGLKKKTAGGGAPPPIDAGGGGAPPPIAFPPTFPPIPIRDAARRLGVPAEVLPDDDVVGEFSYTKADPSMGAVVQVLVRNQRYWMKKDADGRTPEPPRTITWRAFGGPEAAWEEVKRRLRWGTGPLATP